MQVPNKTVGNRGTLRKVLSMLLAVVMVVSMLPVTAYASVSDEQEHWGQTVNSMTQTVGRPILSNAVKELLSETKEDAGDDSGTAIEDEPVALDDAVLDKTNLGNKSSKLLSVFEKGDGTVKSPYQIATAEQLDKVRNYLDKHFILIADIDLSGYENWNPIGIFQPLSEQEEDAETADLEVAFSGNFDGNGHTISNVTISQPFGMAVGLFGCAIGRQGKPSSIYDLTVKNVDVTGYFLVGGVVGFQAADCTLKNLSLTGSNTVRGHQGEGGIVGVSFGKLSGCDAEANIVILGDDGACAGVLSGGLEEVSMSDCTAKGTVTAESDACWGLGGLTGGASRGVAITNCYAEASITAMGENNSMVGGLLGYTGTYGETPPTQVTGCTAKATITVSSNTTRIGGIVGGGYYREADKENIPIPAVYKISGCASSGSITGGTDRGTIAGYSYNSTVEKCTSTMTIDGVANLPQIGKEEIGVSPFAGGKGTVSDPYQIATAEQLDKVRNYLDKHFILIADIDLSGYENWNPIGAFQPASSNHEDEENPDPAMAFTGSFNGNGRTISNVTINQPQSMGVGLFGCTLGNGSDPIVRNLIVTNAQVTGNFLVGGVIGYQAEGSPIEKIQLTGTNNQITGSSMVGGITGAAASSDIKDCSAQAAVISNGEKSQAVGVLGGGLENCSLISGCSAKGSVTVIGAGSYTIGGLAGCAHKSSSVKNCTADVTISVGENNSMIGGLLGFTGTFDEKNPTIVSNCTVKADISAPASASRIGGIVGSGLYIEEKKDDMPTPSVYKISGCSSSGTISGGSERGTIAGYSYHSIVEKCTSTMTSDGVANLPQIGKVELAAPALTADSSGNIAGRSVDLTFSDDPAWRKAISGISVDGTTLTAEQYTVTATSTKGNINIAVGVLTTVGDHSIVIKASGYSNSTVVQSMVAASHHGGGGSGGGSSVNTESGTVNPGGDNTQYNQTALAALANATTQQIQNAQLSANAPALDPAATTSVSLTTNDGIQIVVPSGAISSQPGPVKIAVELGTIATPPKAETTAVVLDPLRYERQFSIVGQTEGSMQFDSPVRITFPIAVADLPAGITPQQLAIYSWNPDRSDWVNLGGAFDTATKTISIPTYHFSTYVVMADTSTLPNRIFGADRFATANAVADQGWKAGADNIVLTYAYAFPDALAAVPLAYKLNAPILLTDAAELTPSTFAEIQKLAPKKIILIGGTAVVSQSIQNTLSATYGQSNVVRYAGEDSYSTAVAIAKALGTTGQAVLANGEDGHYTDALAVSGYAATNGIPILFSETTRLPKATSQALSALNVKTTIVVGGEGAVSEAVYQQLSGATRYGGIDCYETATTIATGLQLNLNRVYIVTGLDFSDALVAGNLAAHTLSPLLIVDKEIPEATSAFLTANQEISSLIAIGGEGIINASQDEALRSDLY